jgi:hypothetical protein
MNTKKTKGKKKARYFNGYSFDDAKTRSRMRYIIVREGDLDVNNAYAVASKREAWTFLGSPHRKTYAVFKVVDITDDL